GRFHEMQFPLPPRVNAAFALSHDLGSSPTLRSYVRNPAPLPPRSSSYDAASPPVRDRDGTSSTAPVGLLVLTTGHGQLKGLQVSSSEERILASSRRRWPTARRRDRSKIRSRLLLN